MLQNTIKSRVIGVEISLHRTTYAIVDLRGNVLVKESFNTSDYPNINDYVSALSERIVAFVDANGGYDTIRSIGISAPSGNFRTGCIENSPNMPWKGIVPLAAMLRDRLGLAVALANNAHVRALGEHTFGIAHGMKNFVVVTMGHGVGSCLFSNGKTHEGYHGFGGEVGHTCIVPDGRLCGCGNRGCLEAYTSAQGIVQTAKEVLAESDAPSRMRTLEKLGSRQIADLCNEGDEMAIEVFRRTGYYLGWALANYASIVNPQAFILTGGVQRAGNWLLEPTRKSFDEHVFLNIKGKVEILLSSLDASERDVLGASALAWKVREYSLFK